MRSSVQSDERRPALRQLPAEVQALALLLGVTVLAALAVSFLTSNTRQTSSPPTAVARSSRPAATPVPAIVSGPLNGDPTSSGLALRRPIAVMVDNFVPDALPQPGLTNASLVFEAPVEGGLTRLMAIYLEKGAPRIGPVRSARPYFVDWAAGYRALFVHAGGSPGAQHLLFHTLRLANVEATLPGRGFTRDPRVTAPHNLYGSTAAVRSLSRRNHWNHRVSYPWLLHKSPAAQGLRGGRQTISVDFSSPGVTSPSAYAVTYNYDPQRNVYLRSMGGSPFDDRDTGGQLAVDNVVVLFTAIAPIAHDKKGRLNVAAIGSGQATYFIDGRATQGRWVKRSALSPLRLLDDRRQPVALNPGTTWIEVVAPGAIQTGVTQ